MTSKASRRHRTTARETLESERERELVVRAFVTVLNEGREQDFLPFLTEDIVFDTPEAERVSGRLATTAAIRAMRDSCLSWRVEILHLAVADSVVLAEFLTHIVVAGEASHHLHGFASFRLEGYRIGAWNHTAGIPRRTGPRP